MRCHEHALPLVQLTLQGLPLHTTTALDAVCAGALNSTQVALLHCGLGPAAVPALVRLLRDGKLHDLHITGRLGEGEVPLLDEAAGAQLAGALATSPLERLSLRSLEFWLEKTAAVAVLHALAGHPTLQILNLDDNIPITAVLAGNGEDTVEAGAALGALVAANAPSLSGLRFRYGMLGDAGLAPLIDALPHNTHLRELDCCGNSMTEEFARERFLPAVRANTSLRVLKASEWWGNEEDGVAPPEVLEAEALVAARAAADDTARAPE